MTNFTLAIDASGCCVWINGKYVGAAAANTTLQADYTQILHL